MARKKYIEVEDLLDRVCAMRDNLQLQLNNPFEDGIRMGIEDVEIEIENIPSADVQPVVRGKWIWKENGEVVCSKCNYLMAIVGNTEDFITVKSYHNFCSNCGAMMEEL